MKNYNEKKICFIICTNNEQYMEECLLYLNLLKVPEGYETELLAITDAKSMASAYNEAMNISDAKYKVYLHQDTFIVEPLFIEKMLKVFKKDKKIGLMGMIGAPKLSKDGVMWHGERYGDFYRLDELIKSGVDSIKKIKRGVREVEVVDGLLMATQYDIPWREDILKGWDFYDVSQCLEFRRAGYKVVVPTQNPSWTIHACGVPAFWNYNKNRDIVLREYPEIQINNDKLRVFFAHSNMITLMGLPYGFMELGHNVFIPPYKVTLNSFIETEAEIIEEELEVGKYDFVVTYDFCPSVSVACERSEVKYFSWVYDSPLLELYMKQAKNTYNHIMVFDKKQYDRLQKMEIQHLYHYPLASEVGVFGGVVITKRDEKKYKSDVSFVGRLYDKRGFEQLFGEEDVKFKEEAEEIAQSCGCRWDGETGVFDKASEGLIEYISSKEPEQVWDIYDIDKRYYSESMRLARRSNEIERVTILNSLAEKFQVTLYTENTAIDSLKNVKICPWVDYWSEMPKVFYVSKINLNITSRSIESGIPQRILDIMAVGGFVLTNFQPELEEHFEIGKDLEVYHSLEELNEKVAYYLKHENERVQIALNGYKKVKKMHTYQSRIKSILAEIQ